jgi:hypothetical protein
VCRNSLSHTLVTSQSLPHTPEIFPPVSPFTHPSPVARRDTSNDNDKRNSRTSSSPHPAIQSMPSSSSSSSLSSSTVLRPDQTSPSDDHAGTPTAPNGNTPGEENAESVDSFYSNTPELTLQNGQISKPWSRVDSLLQKDFAREKKAGKLTFERKIELYGEKLEEKFRELENRLLTREEELLLKGRELQRTSLLLIVSVSDACEIA